MSKNKILIGLIAAGMTSAVLIGCGKTNKNSSSISGTNSTTASSTSIYDPDDPNNSISAGSIVKDSDFSRALEYKYDNFTLVYDQLYNNEQVEEYGYIYYVNGISYVLDYTAVEATGFEYLYYSTYKDDGYMYWQKADGYVYDGWVNNGYRDSDLAMYNAYFDLHRFLSIITKDDVDYILGAFYVKESSMQKYKAKGLEFFGDPFFQVEEITTIGFLTDKETGRITKIMGACDEKSDNGFMIEISNFGETSVPQGALNVKAPYYNNDNDRNIYTYKEMKGDAYVPDVWPTGVTLKTVGDVKKEAGYDAVVEISESVELAYELTPNNVNRLEFEWVVSNEKVIDTDYKANFTSHHKYATGIEPGEAYVSVKVQVESGKWVESNKIKIKVNQMAAQDKTNAVYDLTITGSQTKAESVDLFTGEALTDRNGNPVTVNNTVFSAYNAITTTAKFNIKAHNANAYEAKNADAFGDDGMVMVVSPAAQEFMNNGFYSEVLFDFGDQQVVSLNFYYALYKSNQRGGALENMSEAYMQTSNDGTTWSDPIDMKIEMQNNFKNVNLDYDAPQKLMTRNFEKASKVRMYFKANMVGNNYWIAMNNFVFSNDSTCHNHEDISTPVTKVNATASANKVKVGKTIQFGATVEPENASITTVTWVSSNPSVGTINAAGLFTGVSEGKTEVYALAHNGVSSEKFEVEVIGQEYLDANYVGKKYIGQDLEWVSPYESEFKATFETLSNVEAKLTLEPKGKSPIVINLTYYTKGEGVNPEHTFNGENNEVLRVKFHSDSVDLFLTGSSYSLGNTHTNDGDELKLYVKASSIKLSSGGNEVTSKDMLVGDTFTFYATVAPTNAYYKSCEASSQNTSVATVAKDENGGFKVTAVSAGETNIVVKNADNVQATLKVTVKAVTLVSSMSLSATSTSIAINAETTVTATINPTNVNSMNLVWSSSNVNIARVTGNGKTATVKGVAAGTATITLTDTISGKTATIQITVTGQSAAIDARFVGVYTGYTDYYNEFIFTVNADGSALLQILDYDGFTDPDTTYMFTVAPDILDRNEVEFVYDEDDSVRLGIYGETLYVYDEADVLEMVFSSGSGLMIEKQ